MRAGCLCFLLPSTLELVSELSTGKMSVLIPISSALRISLRMAEALLVSGLGNFSLGTQACGLVDRANSALARYCCSRALILAYKEIQKVCQKKWNIFLITLTFMLREDNNTKILLHLTIKANEIHHWS